MVNGSISGKGGAPLRWRALREALSHRGPCAIRETGCHRWFQCRPTCQADGQTATGRRGWYYDAMFCPTRADQLAADLLRAGVSTVVCSGLETHGYVEHLAARHQFTVVYDMHNVEAALHREMRDAAPPGSVFAERFTTEHVHMVAAAEARAVTAADEVWTCSPQDRDLVRATYPDIPRRKVQVVPNAVAVPAAMPVEQPRRVCYLGRMDYLPNVDAARRLVREVAPRLARLGHDLPVVIGGALAEEELGGWSLPPNVRLVSGPGQVDDLVRGSIVATPLRVGGGSRFKLLEAFALGAPVASTEKGAEGLRAVPGVHYLRAESAEEFATAIDRLVREPRLRQDLTAAAFELVSERYSVAALAEILLGRPRTPSPPHQIAAWSGLEPQRRLTGGHRNQLILAHRGDRRLVVRRSTRPAESLEWELDLLGRLAGHGIPVPRVVPADDGRRHVDGLVVQEFVEGREPRDPADWRRVVETLTAVHEATAGMPQRPGSVTIRHLLTDERGGDVRLDLMPAEAVAAIRRAWQDVEEIGDAAGCAVHGDVAAGNVLIGPDGGVTLLDWDEARVDVPWLDFALIPDEVEVPWANDRRGLRAAGVAWEAANCWSSQPTYARHRLAELYRTHG